MQFRKWFLVLGVTMTLQPIATAEPNSLTTYQVVSLEKEYRRFWSEASGKSFAVQVMAWDKIIEKPHQAFYDSFVWNKKSNPKWEERKQRRLMEMFGKYPNLNPSIETYFKNFPTTLELQVAKFKTQFKDANFKLPIYAVPSTTFNGKGGESGGQTVLAFGIDMIADRHDDTDVLYSHELFHIYHTDTIGINEKVFTEQGKLTLPLWLEGLATYVSGSFNPSATEAIILMADDLAKLNHKDLQWLASAFLKEAEGKALDLKNPGIYTKWFGFGGEKLRKDLPDRCGYLLGLNVVRHLTKTNGMNEMVHWKVPEVHRYVLKALKELTAKDN